MDDPLRCHYCFEAVVLEEERETKHKADSAGMEPEFLSALKGTQAGGSDDRVGAQVGERFAALLKADPFPPKGASEATFKP